MDEDFKLASYDYELPEDQIAQHPADSRDGSKLMVLNRDRQERTFAEFSSLEEFIPENALLVVNNSKVIPARLYGKKPTGGKVEFLLLTPIPLFKIEEKPNGFEARVEGLLRASKGPRPGEIIVFDGNFALEVLEKGDFGKSLVKLRWTGNIETVLAKHGEMPLPPYISREVKKDDLSRYQTIYARDDKAGSVAAPTAGLHFTDDVRQKLLDKGISWAEVTLYVGYGTFSPVRCDDIRDHAMHEEYIEVPEETAEAVRKAKAEGRPIIAVGTTSARTLEGMFAACGKIEAFSGGTDIFIYPGYEFHVVDKLLTNFHLPKSSLVIMVSALAGRRFILDSYAEALAEGFRVFSYGDAMLIS